MSEREHGTEDRLRDALHAKAQADDISIDAWAKIRGGVNEKAGRRRTAVWASLGLAGAAAAVIAVVSFAVLSDDGDQQVVDTPDNPDTGFVVLTNDGQIVHYDATGRNLGVVADSGWEPGLNFAGPEITVSDDTVFFTRHAASKACGPGETENIVERTSEIVSVPLEGGELEVVAEIGASPAVSPDGSTLAYLSTPSGDRCSDAAVAAIDPTADGTIVPFDRDRFSGERTAVALLDLETGERTVPDVSWPEADEVEYEPSSELAWSPDGSQLATNSTCTAAGCESFSATLIPARGGDARFVYTWGGDLGGPALAFFGDDLLVDTSDQVGDQASIGITPTDVPAPLDQSSIADPYLITFPDQTYIDGISTLPGDDAPGILVTTEDYGDNPGTAAVLYSDGRESIPKVLAEDVSAAVWIPGTTAEDLTSETAQPDAVDATAEIPIDTAYLPGVGFTETLAADETGVWVVVADGETGGSTGIVHVSSETNEVDDTADVAGIQSLLLLDGDLWYSRGDSVGRFSDGDSESGTETASSAFESLGVGDYRGGLTATDTRVWTIAGQSSVAFFDRETGVEQGTVALDGTVQQIVALGDDLWVETDALPDTLSRLDVDTGELVDGVDLPERSAVTYAVADGTIWTVDTGGNLVPLVGARAGDDPLATGISSARLVPTDEGLAVSGGDDRQLRRYSDDLEPLGGVMSLALPDRGGLDGPWGGMVIAADTAWWQNAVGPSILRLDLGG